MHFVRSPFVILLDDLYIFWLKAELSRLEPGSIFNITPSFSERHPLRWTNPSFSHSCLSVFLFRVKLPALNTDLGTWLTGLDIFKPTTVRFCFWILSFWHPARFSPWLAAFQQACLWLSLSFHFSHQLKTGFSADAAQACISWSLYNSNCLCVGLAREMWLFFSAPWKAF